MKLILTVLAFLSLQVALSDDVGRLYEWSKIDIVGVRPSVYDSSNIIPTGVAYDADSKMLFFGLPRKYSKVPITVAQLSTRSYNSAERRDPPLDKFSGKSKKPLTSVYQPVIDDCRRLWVLDVGIVEVKAERKTYPTKNPALVAFDLTKPDYPEIHRYELTGDAAKTPLGYGGFAVDVVNPKKCGKNDEKTYVYIANFVENSLIVYDKKKSDAWVLKDDSFKPEGVSTYTHNGKEHELKTGIFGIALGDRNKEGNRPAYYLAGSSTKLYRLDTKLLKKKGSKLVPKLIGDRGYKTEAIALAYDPETKVLFFAETDSRQVSCWNIKKELKPENVGVIYSSAKLNFATDMMVDSKGFLWFMSNGQPPFDEKMKYEDPHIRLMKVKTKKAIKGEKRCQG
uniref:Yellow-related salivary protein M35 n=1 Tax=Phlebotomus duboscqi TaxID=37738 RepID=YP35_PHLDU|nr:42.6 kDa salivary protein [Phlebotomus duboscqi]